MKPLQPFFVGSLIAMLGVAAATAAAPVASAQTANPGPTASPCTQPDSRGFFVSPSTVEQGEPVTITVTYDQPCGEPDAHDTPVYARAEGEADFQRIATLSTPAERQSRASLTATPSVTTTYSLDSAGQGPQTHTVTVTVTRAQPAASPSPAHQDPACPTFTVQRPTVPIKVGDIATITATIAEHEEQPGQFFLQRYVPEPFAVVRQSDKDVRTVTWVVRLGQSHRLAVGATRGSQCLGGGTGTTFFDIAVRPSLTIAATRNAVRDYTFTGSVLPGRGQLVTLYRHDADRRVITAQSRIRPDGTYRFDRRFTGSGRFGFSVAVSTSSTNLAGASVVRPTVIH